MKRDYNWRIFKSDHYSSDEWLSISKFAMNRKAKQEGRCIRDLAALNTGGKRLPVEYSSVTEQSTVIPIITTYTGEASYSHVTGGPSLFWA